MPKTPVISYNTLVKKLLKAGFMEFRANKHIIYTKENLTIPIPKKHQGDIPKGTLRAIIKQMNVTVEQFINL